MTTEYRVSTLKINIFDRHVTSIWFYFSERTPKVLVTWTYGINAEYQILE